MDANEIRSVLVPLTGQHLLMPNATIAEVIGYSQPDPLPGSPDWLLGTVEWHGWRVPLVSFAVLTEAAETESIAGARICITKSLVENPRMPYVGILAQGFPRLTTVTRENLTEVPSEHNPISVAGTVIIDSTEAVIPDLERLSHLVGHAAFGSLPLTG